MLVIYRVRRRRDGGRRGYVVVGRVEGGQVHIASDIPHGVVPSQA
jgi:hypothetical protein